MMGLTRCYETTVFYILYTIGIHQKHKAHKT